MPDAKCLIYDVAANSSSTFHFVVQGKKIKKGVKVKFRIIPDILDDESEYIIETKPFILFANPL